MQKVFENKKIRKFEGGMMLLYGKKGSIFNFWRKKIGGEREIG
jgi:hypothetical protein